MLDANLKDQLKAYLENVREPIELVAAYDDSNKSQELKELLEEIEPLSDKIALRTEDDPDVRRPSFAINRVNSDIGVRFAGIPMGHEFTSLVLALLQVGGHPSKASQEVIEQIQSLDGDFEFETFFSLSCQNCPDVVQALNLLSILNPKIKHTSIDGALFQDEVERKEIMAVPAVFLNGEPWGQGRMTLEEIVAKLDSNAGAKEAEKINQKDPFEVLVIGGGPAGSSAAIYSARKGIRTGIAAERFGGAARQGIRRGYHEHAACREADPGLTDRRLSRDPPGEWRLPEGPQPGAVHRCPLAPTGCSRRGGVPQQGRGLLPPL